VNLKTMRLERDGAVARLIFTQGQRGNPIDGPFCADFLEVANELSEDKSVRAVLMLAEGKNFSFGGDVISFSGLLDVLPSMIKRWTASLHMGIARLARIDAPIVAAVQGVCAGGMNGLVAGADYVVARPNARFVAAYAQIGFCADAGTTMMLTRRMGIARAKRFLLMSETIEAEAAQSLGLVDELADENLTARAQVLARTFAEGPTKAYGELRRLFLSVGEQPLEAQLEIEALALARCSGTADAREGLTAFVGKRKPVFKGE
jgi:2-(1,2-epoxy-1,2-dihydrophenyl)acetyl-CoA isomerase